MPQGKNRYPGIRSFEPDDQRLFYSRSKEIEQLYNLIKIKPLVVLFGKSGLGKTSLLKAGVNPLLLKQHYYPLIIRLQDTSVAPTNSVLSDLEPFVDKDLFEKFGDKTSNKIWEYVKASSFKTPDGATATPILVFDQFEELFNHPKDVKEEWASHIGDLIDNRLPADIEEALNEIPRSQRTKELMAWFRPPDVKIVFAIRSDFISELHSLRHEIPAILQNRYELKPLKTHQAKEAIEKPAALEGKEFLTAPFAYDPETIEKIQKELSNKFGEIESFQLQIICQYIERKVKKEQAEGKQNIVVSPDYLGEDEGIRGILKNYYNTQISLLGTNEEQATARILLEEALIVNKRRISVAEGVVKENYNISDDLLEKLLASRLIRPEDTRLGRTYEISHDTLVKPILDAFRKRKINEVRLEEIQQRSVILKKRKRARIAAIVNFLIAVGFAIGGFIALQYFWEAEAAKDRLADLLIENEELANTALKETIELIDSTIENTTKESEREVLMNQRQRLERTKTDLKSALSSPESKGSKDLEKINISRTQKLINALVLANNTGDEAVREKARNTFLRSYKNDPTIITAILNVAKDNINEEHRNNIYQIIYLLEHSTPEALNGNNNTKRVLDYTTSIRNANLVGKKTLGQIDIIEGKLKGSNEVKLPDEKKEIKDNQQTDTIEQTNDVKPPKDEKKSKNENQSDDGKQTKNEKKSDDGKNSNDENH